MSTDSIEVFAGDCTVTFQHDDVRQERGAVVVLAKPDGTVLVHDRAGYRPVAWLTRAESVSWENEGDTPVLEAVDNGRHLRITCHARHGRGRYLASRSGAPVGPCPDCGGVLVHARGEVTCVGCTTAYSIPSDAEVLEASCGTCGLPRMAVERGATFEVCVDRQCESLDDLVRQRFDRTWECPSCGGDLRVLRRGGLLLGCEHYPDCETGFSFPVGSVKGSCECGLPSFATASGSRCLDAGCAET